MIEDGGGDDDEFGTWNCEWGCSGCYLKCCQRGLYASSSCDCELVGQLRMGSIGV